jgi:hypothetical protein
MAKIKGAALKVPTWRLIRPFALGFPDMDHRLLHQIPTQAAISGQPIYNPDQTISDRRH